MTAPILKHQHEIAIEQRNLEISLFWQRSNYFLILNTGLLVAFFTNALEEYALLIALFGAVVACLWLLTNAGSKFWQERWEIAVTETEPSERDYKLFEANTTQLKEQVEKRLREQTPKKSDLYIRLITLKPSVSFLMILLSALFLCAWLALFFGELHKFCSCSI